MTKMPHWPRSISGRLVAFGLMVALAVLGTSCGGDDDESTPTGPPVAGNAAVQASAGIAFATFTTVFGTLLEGLPEPGKTNGESGLLRLAIDKAFEAMAAKNGDGRYIAAVETCPGGGTGEDTCFSTGGLTYAQISASNCVFLGSGRSLTIDGSFSLEAELADACGLKVLPDSVGVSINYDHFSMTIRDTLTGAVVDSFGANFTIVTQPTGPGCHGTNGILTMSGTFSRLVPLEDEALTFQANNFTITASSDGDPCKTTLVLNGTASLEDESVFTETFSNLILTRIAGVLDTVTIDGTVSTNCVGSLTFDTIEPILLQSGADCPIGGLVEVTLPHGSAWIRFTATGGIEFDFNRDGTADATFATCDEEAIPHCHQPS